MSKSRTISIDRILWDSVVSLLTRLEANDGNESVHYFQGGAETVLENIRARQPDVLTERRSREGTT